MKRRLGDMHITADGLRFATTISGDPCVFPFGQGHMLIAGRTGAGKSTVLRSVIWEAAHRSDCIVLAVDLKKAELTPWSERLEWLATDRRNAVRLLTTVRNIIDLRLNVLTERGAVEWDVAYGPWALLVIDELAELLAGPRSAKADIEEAEALLDSVSRIGRAVGVHVIAATQRPSVEVLGGSLRDQLAYRMGLAVSDKGTSSLVTQGAAVDLTTVSDLGIGWGYYISPGQSPVLARGDYHDERCISAVVAATGQHRRRP